MDRTTAEHLEDISDGTSSFKEEAADVVDLLASGAEAAILDATAKGEGWTAEAVFADYLEKSQELAPQVVAAGVRAAHLLRNPWLALARSLLPTAGSSDQRANAALVATRLNQLGYKAIALRVLLGAAVEDRGAADAFARIDKGSATSDAMFEVLKRLYARYRTGRLRSAFAFALADRLHYDRARALLEKTVKQQPGKIGPLRDLCRFYKRIGDYASWGEALRVHADRFVQNTKFESERIAYLLETGEIQASDDLPLPSDMAEADFDPKLVSSLALQYMVEERQGQATDMRIQAVENNDTAYSHAHAIQALLHSGRTEEGEAFTRQALARFPGDPRFHVKLGQLHERRREFGKALQSFTNAFAVAPQNLHAASGVARCLIYLGRCEAALDWLGRFPQNSAEFGWVHAMRAFAFARGGDAVGASAALQPLYVLCAAVGTAFERAQAKNPANMLLGDDVVRHPNSGWPAWAGAYLDTMRALKDGNIVLVGNAPSLIGQGKGPAIDAFDHVIRLNDFRLRGYETDFGTRTTVWYSAAARLARPGSELDRGVQTFLYQPVAQHFPDVERFARRRLKLEVEEAKTAYLPPHIHMLTERLIYSRPSTGFRIIGFLEFMLQRPYAVAGFNFFQQGDLHYFEPGQESASVSEVHAIDFERDFTEMVLLPQMRMKTIG